MKVLLTADMEGISRIVDHHECWPVCAEYWETGRERMTADVINAAEGLLAGGASEVIVGNAHGLGTWPNFLAERFPARVELLTSWETLPEPDALFQLGYHARCGTMHGFISHTNVPELAMKVDGRLITENHQGAWIFDVPVLGITGDAALGPQLDGSLADTPFLTVKHSTSRMNTKPAHPSPEQSAEAIRDFARQCASGWRDRQKPRLPERFTVEFSLPSDLADLVSEGEHNLRRASPSVLKLEATSWNEEARPAWIAVLEAAAQPLDEQATLDVSSKDAVESIDPQELARHRKFWSDWVAAPQVEWRV